MLLSNLTTLGSVTAAHNGTHGSTGNAVSVVPNASRSSSTNPAALNDRRSGATFPSASPSNGSPWARDLTVLQSTSEGAEDHKTLERRYGGYSKQPGTHDDEAEAAGRMAGRTFKAVSALCPAYGRKMYKTLEYVPQTSQVDAVTQVHRVLDGTTRPIQGCDAWQDEQITNARWDNEPFFWHAREQHIGNAMKAIGKMDDNASDQDYPDPDDTAASEDLPESAAPSLLLSKKANLAAIAATVGSLYLL